MDDDRVEEIMERSDRIIKEGERVGPSEGIEEDA